MNPFAAVVRTVRRLVLRPTRLRWNPIVSGYPRSLGKRYWDHPASLIGKEFDHHDGRYRVEAWDASQGRDCDEDDGCMTAIRISQNNMLTVSGERQKGAA